MLKKYSLKLISPQGHPLCKDKQDALAMTEPLQRKLYELLYLMFAHNQFSLLIVLHGIDTSGKDGTVRHIFSAANPQGISVFSFKKPTLQELHHDFIWRCHLRTPECGLATVFNRSYYEEVTTTMVHPHLLKEQNIHLKKNERPLFFKNINKCVG